MNDTYENIITKSLDTVSCSAITGNGDLSVALYKNGDDLCLCVSKYDFIKMADGVKNAGGIKPVFSIGISSVDLENYKINQCFKKGTIIAELSKCSIEIFVANENRIYIKISASDRVVFPSLDIEVPDTSKSNNFSYADDSVKWYLRKFAGSKVYKETAAAICLKRLPTIRDDGIKSVCFCVGVVTNFDTREYISKSIDLAVNCDYVKDKAFTEKRWTEFFEKTSVTLSNKEIERFYNSSLYYLACSGGNEMLLNPFDLDEKPAKYRDFSLSGTFAAYCRAMLCAGNCDIIRGSIAHITNFLNTNLSFDSVAGCKGLRLYDCEEWKLKLSACVSIVLYWQYTNDKAFAGEHIYPYLKEAALSARDALTLENGKYVINETVLGKEVKNSTGTLNLFAMLFEGLVDMSKALDRDELLRKEWSEILNKLSDYPTRIHFGKRCFSISEKGKPLPDELSALAPVLTCGALEDNKKFKIAKNTFSLYKPDFRKIPASTYFTAGVRLKMSPFEKLEEFIKGYSLENMLFNSSFGNLDSLSAVVTAINESLLRSCGGIIEVFPAFPKNQSGSYNCLRAQGGFLVSAAIKNGKLTSLTLKSLLGNEAKVQLVGEANVSVVSSTGKKVKFKKRDNIIYFKTIQGETYKII